MPVVMKSDQFAIVFINAGGGNDRTAKVSADVFGHDFGITLIGPGVNIKTVFMVFITGSLYFLKGRTKMRFQFIRESGAESIPEKRVVEMFHIPPEAVITVPALRDETVDMGIPFKVSPESMQNHDKAWSIVFGLIHLAEHK